MARAPSRESSSPEHPTRTPARTSQAPPAADGTTAAAATSNPSAVAASGGSPATGRASRRGFVLDSVVDRLTEAAYASALWAAGAPGWLAVAFGALCWLPDYLRARAGQAGVGETGALSVWERPTRVALTGMTLLGAGVLAGFEVAGAVVTAGTAVGTVLGAVGVAQLGVSLRRMLAD